MIDEEKRLARKEYNKKYYQEHKEENKEYYQKNKERILKLHREYKETHKKKIKECNKKYYQKNIKEIKKYRKKLNKKYYEQNKRYYKEYRNERFLKYKEYNKKWNKNNKDKIAKYFARRKNFGFEPINDWFKDSHYHHLHINGNHNIGIFIPKTIHKSIWHSNKDQESMNKINKVAYTWLDIFNESNRLEDLNKK